jgi:hypothetical protein
MLVSTQWPDDPEWQRKMNLAVREGDLRRDFWRDMVRGGSKMWRLDNNKATAQAIIRTLMQKDPVEFALQKEMVEGKSLENTTAGTFIVTARHEDEKRHSRLSVDLRNDPTNNRLSQNVEKLQESINQRRVDEEKLKENILKSVKEDIKKAVQDEMKNTGRRPTVNNIISWLLSIGSITASVVQAALGG